MPPAKDDDAKSMDSWGARPRPKGLGTKHLHFDVPKSGYLREAIASETHTRNHFYDTKFGISRPPNTVFGETPSDVTGQYLVPLPADHECYSSDPSTGTARSRPSSGASNTLRGRTVELVHTLQGPQNTVEEGCRKLASRIAADQLKAKRAAVFEQLRLVDVKISKNARERERSLVEPEGFPFPPEPILPNRGLKTTLQSFPSLRSKPRFTQRIAGLGFP